MNSAQDLGSALDANRGFFVKKFDPGIEVVMRKLRTPRHRLPRVATTMQQPRAEGCAPVPVRTT